MDREQPEVVPDWDDVPEDDTAEPDDADTDNPGPDEEV